MHPNLFVEATLYLKKSRAQILNDELTGELILQIIFALELSSCACHVKSAGDCSSGGRGHQEILTFSPKITKNSAS